MRGATPRLRTHEPTAKHLLSAHPSNPPTPTRPGPSSRTPTPPCPMPSPCPPSAHVRQPAIPGALGHPDRGDTDSRPRPERRHGDLRTHRQAPGGCGQLPAGIPERFPTGPSARIALTVARSPSGNRWIWPGRVTAYMSPTPAGATAAWGRRRSARLPGLRPRAGRRRRRRAGGQARRGPGRSSPSQR